MLRAKVIQFVTNPEHRERNIIPREWKATERRKLYRNSLTNCLTNRARHVSSNINQRLELVSGLIIDHSVKACLFVKRARIKRCTRYKVWYRPTGVTEFGKSGASLSCTVRCQRGMSTNSAERESGATLFRAEYQRRRVRVIPQIRGESRERIKITRRRVRGSKNLPFRQGCRSHEFARYESRWKELFDIQVLESPIYPRGLTVARICRGKSRMVHFAIVLRLCDTAVTLTVKGKCYNSSLADVTRTYWRVYLYPTFHSELQMNARRRHDDLSVISSQFTAKLTTSRLN